MNDIKEDLLEKALLSMYERPELSSVRETLSNAALSGEGEIEILTGNGRITVRSSHGMSEDVLRNRFLVYGNSEHGYGYGSLSPLAVNGDLRVETCDGKTLSSATVRAAGNGTKCRVDVKESSSAPFTEISWTCSVDLEEVEEMIKFDDSHVYVINHAEKKPLKTLFHYRDLTYKTDTKKSLTTYAKAFRDIRNLNSMSVKVGFISYPCGTLTLKSCGFCVEMDPDLLSPSKEKIPEDFLEKAKKRVRGYLKKRDFYDEVAGDEILGEMLYRKFSKGTGTFHLNGKRITADQLIDLYIEDDYPNEVLSIGDFSSEDIKRDITGSGFYSNDPGSSCFGKKAKTYSDEEISRLRGETVRYRKGTTKIVETDSFEEPPSEWYTTNEKFYSICKGKIDLYWIEKPLEGLRAKRIEDDLLEFKKANVKIVPRCVFFTENGIIEDTDPWLAIRALKIDENVRLREDLSYLTPDLDEDLFFRGLAKKFDIFERRFEKQELSKLNTCLKYGHFTEDLSDESTVILKIQREHPSIDVSCLKTMIESREPLERSETEELIEFMLKEVR